MNITLTMDDLRSLPMHAQDAIIGLWRTPLLAAEVPSPQTTPEPPPEDHEIPPNLKVGQVQALLSGCGVKTKAVLRMIAKTDDGHFRIGDIAQAFNCEPTKLAGVWAGITKRIRAVLRDDEVSLFAWISADTLGDTGGWLSPITHASLRQAFHLD